MENGETERIEQDENDDGKADITLFYKKGKLQRREISTKRNGRTDVWYFYSAKGEINRKEQDTNGDGRPDLRVVYVNNQPVRSEEDRDYDGRAERVVFFKAGKIARVRAERKGSHRGPPLGRGRLDSAAALADHQKGESEGVLREAVLRTGR